MKDYLNKKVKFREYFRPFAPAILKEKYKEYFHLNQESPHMLIACKANKKKSNLIPAVVHVDGTCRVQTVSKETNLKFYNLIKEFNKLTSVPVVLNTSFNIKGQPMVNTPSQAIDTFTGTKIDILAIGDYIVFK
jgi:carbamoyltransferase